jgi:two-component system nitrate/nitrite response regulator NarL
MCATLSVVSAPNGAQPIRILIAYRNRLDSQLLGESLERNPHFHVVALPEAAQLLSAAAASKPDVALISLDLDSSPQKGLQLARRLNASQPGVHIAILLDTTTRESVIAAFRNGARAVFSRGAGLPELGYCIERTSRGEIFASNTEAEYLLEALRAGPSCDAIDIDTLNKLSKREIEVAECAAQGHTNRQIAEQLRLSEHTIKNYLSRAYEKLGVSTRMELLVLLSQHKVDSARHSLDDVEPHRPQPAPRERHQ